MAEKVLHELGFVETDDGYRIEIKGDKERMREIFKEMRSGRWCGPRGLRHPGFMAGLKRARRLRGFGPWHWWRWADWYDGEPEAEEEPTEER